MSPGDRYREVVERVAEAAHRSGRSPDEITVVAAAKTFGVAEIADVVRAGARDIGENYVQEARAKRAALAAPGVRWHLIGRLQRNKARTAVDLFDRIHSLDSLTLAKALDEAGSRARRRVTCLVEVNLGAETAKGGVDPSAVEPLLGALGALPWLSVDGLMAIPPLVTEPDRSHVYFRRLRALRDDLARLRLPGVQLKELSMGMSADFEIAVEEGATMVRVGTAIFGRRA